VAVREMGSKFVHGLPYKPSTQGQVERVNQTIKRRVSNLFFFLYSLLLSY